MSRLSWRRVIVWRTLAVGGSFGPSSVLGLVHVRRHCRRFQVECWSVALTFGYEATRFPGLEYCCVAAQSVSRLQIV